MIVAAVLKARSITLPKAPALTDEDRKKGVKILMSLQTVEDALRADDTISVQITAAQVLEDEQENEEFTSFILEVATDKRTARRKVVEELLLDCFGRTG